MNEGNGAAAPESQGHTRESLFPPNWDKPKAPESAETAETETEASSPLGEPEALAPEHEALEEQEVDEPPPEAVSEDWRMAAGQFSNQAGISLHELNNNITFNENGKQMTISQIRNEAQTLRDTHEALLRERNELQERINTQAVQAPQPGVSPEAQALMAQAQIYAQALQTTDWSQMDPAVAANQKFDLQQAAMAMQQQAQQKQMEHHQKLQERAEKARSEAERQTRAAIPEWTDARVYEAEWREIGDMLHAYGVTPQETAEITDPRIRRLLRDHLKLRGDKARIVEGAKKVRKVSKTLGAGSRTPEKGKPTLKDVKQILKDAKSKGATREELQKMRLQMPLG